MIDRFATSAGVQKIKPAERAGRKSDLRQLQERISCHNGHGKQAGGDKWGGGGGQSASHGELANFVNRLSVSPKLE